MLNTYADGSKRESFYKSGTEDVFELTADGKVKSVINYSDNRAIYNEDGSRTVREVDMYGGVYSSVEHPLQGDPVDPNVASGYNEAVIREIERLSGYFGERKNPPISLVDSIR